MKPIKPAIGSATFDHGDRAHTPPCSCVTPERNALELAEKHLAPYGIATSIKL
jgi:hypothetical protein